MLATGDRRLLPGCAPAWRPDGTLTAAYEDEVVSLPPVRGADPVRRDVDRPGTARARCPAPPERPRPAGAPASARGRDCLAFRHARRGEYLDPARRPLRGARPARRDRLLRRAAGSSRAVRTSGSPGGRLAASPRGSYVTQTPDVILRPDGSRVNLPQHLRGCQRLRLVARRAAARVRDAVRRRGRRRRAASSATTEQGGGLRSVTLPQVRRPSRLALIGAQDPAPGPQSTRGFQA